MSSLHLRQIDKLLGTKGGLFVSKAYQAVTSRPLLAGAAVIGLSEFIYKSTVIPPGHKSSTMRLDLLFSVSNESKIYIGVEVKTTESDLLFSEKIQYELVADYLFLATPRNLIPAALYIITNQPADIANKIGLFDLSSMDVVVRPNRFNTKIDDFGKQLVDSQRSHTIIVHSDPRTVASIQFRKEGKIQINEMYSGMLQKEYHPKLPTPGECYQRYQNSVLFQQLLRKNKS